MHFVTDVEWRKLSLPGFRHLTLITSTPRQKALVPWWDKHLMLMVTVCGGVVCIICYPCAMYTSTDLTGWLHGAQSFLKSLVSQLVIKYQHFMETASSLLLYLSLSSARSIHSVYHHPPDSFKIHSNIILPSMPKSPKWSLSLSSSLPTNTLYKSLLSPIHVTCPTHLILFDFNTNNVWWRVQIMKLLTV